MMRGYGQELVLSVPKPDLPGYVTVENHQALMNQCSDQVGALTKKWDDHVPVMIGGGIAIALAGYLIGKAM